MLRNQLLNQDFAFIILVELNLYSEKLLTILISREEEQMTITQQMKSQEVRFKFYHQLDQTYHQFLDELAQTDFGDGEIGRLAQTVMLSRQEALKHLVSLEEMNAYNQKYPQADE